jgi:hypothetical protein
MYGDDAHSIGARIRYQLDRDSEAYKTFTSSARRLNASTARPWRWGLSVAPAHSTGDGQSQHDHLTAHLLAFLQRIQNRATNCREC